MATIYTENMIQIIVNEYPDALNKDLANKLGITESALTSKAYKLGISKSDDFMKGYYSRLQENRKLKHEQNYRNYQMNNIERNIIVGSLLGDGFNYKEIAESLGRSYYGLYDKVRIMKIDKRLY